MVIEDDDVRPRDPNRRWHCRIRGADKPVIVHCDNLVDLREEIERRVSHLEEEAYQRSRSRTEA